MVEKLMSVGEGALARRAETGDITDP